MDWELLLLVECLISTETALESVSSNTQTAETTVDTSDSNAQNGKAGEQKVQCHFSSTVSLRAAWDI